MDGPLPGNTSGTARLMVGAPSYAVGWQEPAYIPAPAPGTSWAYTVGGKWYERVVSLYFVFNASGVVANRLIVLQLQDTNGAVICEVQAGGLITAGVFFAATLTSDAPGFDTGAAGHTYGYIPGFLIPPGWKWVATVAGMDAGDAFANIVMLVQRYPSDAVEIQANG
jgi:hypothetical protein